MSYNFPTVYSPIDSCFVQSSHGNLDLTNLYRKETDYFAYSNEDNQIYFNLCGPSVEPRCNEAGACLFSRANPEKTWLRIGNYSSASITVNAENEIIYRMNGIDTCTVGNSKFNTGLDIRLICNDEEKRPHFDFVEKECRYHLSFYSPRVCWNQLINDGCTWNGYSLKPLRKTIDTTVKNKATSYLLNLCGPLNSNQCGKNVSICAKLPNSESSLKLGYAPGILNLDSNGTLMWTSQGETCSDGTLSSAKIRFPCIHSTTNSPKLLYGEGLCGKTIFEWPSEIGCLQQPQTETGSGIFFFVLLVLLLLYCTIGYLFKRFKLGYQGLEAIPHYEAIDQFFEWVRFKVNGGGRIRI